MFHKGEKIGSNRIYFLDHLRTLMIFFVVLIHSGLVYEKSIFSSYFWIVYDPTTNDLAVELRLLAEIFTMPLIFFIAGYFAPKSLAKKSVWKFISGKAKRLLLPWLVAVLTLLPLYKIIYLASRNLPQQPWLSYFHWSNGLWGQNWLWFLPALFLFQFLFAFGSKLGVRTPSISLALATGVVFILGFLSSMVMDIAHLQGWTKTIVLDFQNERLLIYFLIYLLGANCSDIKIFDSPPKRSKLNLFVLGAVLISIFIYRHFYFQFLVTPGQYTFSFWPDKLLYWSSFHISLFGSLYLFIIFFWTYLNKSNGLADELTKNSYPLYIIHTVVMGGIAWALLSVGMPSIVKFAILTLSTFVACNVLISLSRRLINSSIKSVFC